MNIHDLVTSYIDFRRTLGERCNSTAGILHAFSRAIGPHIPVARIRIKAVMGFLNGSGPITRTWRCKHSALKGLFRFAVSRGHLKQAPLPIELPQYQPKFVPYIYSRQEIGKLLEAIPIGHHSACCIEQCTLRTILLLLYGAGLRCSEALNLSMADVNLSNNLITIRDGKFFKCRYVPVGGHLVKVLSDYVCWRTEAHPLIDPTSAFFVSRFGGTIHRRTLERAFQRLRERIGLRRTDGIRQQPRLHDLRHTFAVHRLTSWYRQGADVQRLVYHLSVYLGHVRLVHTQIYLTMTPELLEQAGWLFEQYAEKEDHHA